MSPKTSKFASRPMPTRVGAMCIAVSLAVGLMAGTAAFSAPAHAEDLLVKYDQSKLVRLPRRAAQIIIGNPTIADVSVQGGTLLVVTGKTFGITNMIALDADRQVIEDRRIVVRRDGIKTVNLMRGEKRQSYNCTPVCNPALTVGDDQAYFDQLAKNAERKVKFSESVSSGGGGGGNN